jgi:C-terminal processing protease CtpA/Prc
LIRTRGFLDKDELDEVRKDDAGEYIGIGIIVDFAAADMVATAMTADSPAYVAGIDPGDTTALIDDATIVGMRLPDKASRMRGVPGSELEIGVRRGGSGAVRTARLHRAALLAQTVRVRPLANGIAWIHVTAFEGRTAQDPVAALKTTDVAPSNYRIRVAYAPHQISSLEAAAQALGQLEGASGRFSVLLDAFDGFVAQQAACVRA